jgi:hypothetical protein
MQNVSWVRIYEVEAISVRLEMKRESSGEEEDGALGNWRRAAHAERQWNERQPPAESDRGKR